MTSPTPVQNARKLLVAALIKGGDKFGMTLFNGFIQAVSRELLGRSDDRPQELYSTPIGDDRPYSGPLAQLALYWAMECDRGAFLDPHGMPWAVAIPTSMLNPLLAHPPMSFTDELFHPFEASLDDAKVMICGCCDLMIDEHFQSLVKLYLAEIEILNQELAVMEATTEIQAQAIQKQTEAAATGRGTGPSIDLDPADFGDGGI